MELKDFLERVIDRSIFKETVKIKVPIEEKCQTCKGTGTLRLGETNTYLPCSTCRGRGITTSIKKEKVDARVLYVPVAFEEKKERVLFVSVAYDAGGRTINTSVKVEDIEIENILEDKQ